MSFIICNFDQVIRSTDHKFFFSFGSLSVPSDRLLSLMMEMGNIQTNAGIVHSELELDNQVNMSTS